MQTDVSVNYHVAERLVGDISGHPGFSPVTSEVQHCIERALSFIMMPGKQKYVIF